MNCSEIFESLSEFIDEDLSEKTCSEIESHMAGCTNCRIVVNTLRKTVTLYHSMPREQLSGAARLRLHRVIKIDTPEGSDEGS